MVWMSSDQLPQAVGLIKDKTLRVRDLPARASP
jgi:hypothetical protein